MRLREAAGRLEFEKAAALRDRLRALKADEISAGSSRQDGKQSGEAAGKRGAKKGKKEKKGASRGKGR